MAISVLGPLAVDGDASSLERRDRVVLAALVVKSGQVVSAEQLADVLWDDAPPATWNKVVQGSVVRLRKVLGAAAIETSTAGYRLTNAPDGVDAHRFERMVLRSVELLTLGEFDRAAYVSSEALALWQGPPLREVEGWEPGRVEAGRLVELRLDAEEVRLDAALRAGRHREVLAEARARATEAPLRERRWALLALAQYQVGRQGDALRTLHQARTVLVTELGLEPGPDLVALQQAILRQDPSLVVAAALPEPGASCPYLGLVPYDIDDSDAFFGRDAEVEACLARLAAVGVLAVVGPSGSGKSSLVRAGVAAALRRNGRRVVVVTPGAHPMDAMTALPAAGPAPVLVVDQCEEAVTLCDDPVVRASFFAAVAAHVEHGPVVIAMRADRLGELSAHPDFARLIEPGLHLLGVMSDTDLRAAIEGPPRQVGLLLEPGLVDLLAREVRGEPGALPLLSHALHETWQRREGRTLTVAGYQQAGGISGSVAQSAEEVYDHVAADQRPLLRDVLLRLVARTPDGEPLPSRIPRRTVSFDDDHVRLIELLVRARLVTSDNETVELAHESLARAWPRLRSWLDDDVEGQRIMRHLAVAADAWDAMGRPDSELYRGVRLLQALEWDHGANPTLTPVERAFLDASTQLQQAEAATTEQRLRQQTRHNRRLRALLAGAAVVLVLALVAGLVAVRQASRADRSAVAADASRVGAQALLTENSDRSLLLAVEGVRLDDSFDTRSNLLAALSRSPELVASTRTDGPPLISLEASPDGKVVGVGEAYGALSFYDTTTRKLLGTYDEMPVWNFEFRPDGQQLAVSAQPNPATGSPLAQPSLRLVDPTTFHDQPVQLGGLPESRYVSAPHYSADGRFLAAAFAYSIRGADSSIVVWDLASPQHPVLNLSMLEIGYEVELSLDGSLLYVGHSFPPTMKVYDVTTSRILIAKAFSLDNPVDGSPLGPNSLPGAWLDLSPNGKLLAAAGGDEIVLFETATLTERRRLQGHTDAVRVIRFSPDGDLLASGSDDRTVNVWTVASGERRDVLRGNAASVWGVGFNHDQDTLYTAAGRGLLTWDLDGNRRFIPRQTFTGLFEDPAFAQVSPTGDAVAYVDNTQHLQFVDLATGRTGGIIQTGHTQWGWFAWRPDGRRYATTGEDGFVREWDWHTGDLINQRHVAAIKITSVDYTGDGRRLVIGEQTGKTYAIDADTLQPVGAPVQLNQPMGLLVGGPDEHTAIVFPPGRYVLVDLDDGLVIHEGPIPNTVSGGAFSSDGRRFAVGFDSGDVRILDIETGEWAKPAIVGHDGPVGTVDYAADGDTFVTGGNDGVVVFWDADTGEPLHRVVPGKPTERGTSPRFLADGHTVLIASYGGSGYTMETSVPHWIDAACVIAGRNLTAKEWTDAFDDRTYHETCPDDSPLGEDHPR